MPSLHVIAYLTLLYTGPHVDTFHRSRRVTTTSVTVTGDTVKQRWLVPTRGNNGFVAGRPVKQPSCHIYLRRLNLSRRSAPFIPSGSTDCITAGATGGVANAKLSVGLQQHPSDVLLVSECARSSPLADILVLRHFPPRHKPPERFPRGQFTFPFYHAMRMHSAD